MDRLSSPIKEIDAELKRQDPFAVALEEVDTLIQVHVLPQQTND